MRIAAASVMSCLLLLAGCAATVPPAVPPGAAFEATVWTLSEFPGHALIGRPVTLRFEAGTLSGQASCNTLAGSYTRKDDVLAFGPLAMSKVYCEQTASLEADYLEVLRKVSKASIEGNTLTLSGATGTLRYAAPLRD